VNIQFKVHNSYDLLLDSYGAAISKGNARVFRFQVQLACGQFGHLIKNLFSYPEFLETKSQRRKYVPLGEWWIVHIFHRMRKEAIQFLHIQENTWQIIVKNSQLYLSKVN
jgi:hypothetical protein